MGKTKTPFELLLVQTIAARHGCALSEAEHIIDLYLPVIRELHDDDGVRIQADRYYHAFHEGRSPESWLAHIHRTKKKYGISTKKTTHSKSSKRSKAMQSTLSKAMQLQPVVCEDMPLQLVIPAMWGLDDNNMAQFLTLTKMSPDSDKPVKEEINVYRQLQPGELRQTLNTIKETFLHSGSNVEDRIGHGIYAKSGLNREHKNVEAVYRSLYAAMNDPKEVPAKRLARAEESHPSQ